VCDQSVAHQYGEPVHSTSALLERLRAASIAQDAGRSAALYAEDAVHEFPFTTPGGPTRIEGRAAIAEFLGTVYRSLPLRYTAYRTIAVHEVSGTTLVVEQEALGVHTATGAPFALPNVAVIEVDANGLITTFRDYVNPAAVAEVLGAVSGRRAGA
jgi:uncharacterized protein